MHASLPGFARALLTAFLVLATGTGTARSPQSSDWLAPLGNYEWPETAVGELLNAIGNSVPGKSARLDAVRIRLVHLYQQLGRYDEAGTTLQPLWLGMSSDSEVTAAAGVLWPLLWSDAARSKGEWLDCLNQLVIAERKLQEPMSPRLWAALSRMVKSRRFAWSLELVPMASEMDSRRHPTADVNVYPQGALLVLLFALAPEAVRLHEGKTSVDLESLKKLGAYSPWKDALLRTAEILAAELRDLDQVVLQDAEVAAASRMNREAASLSARGKMQDAIPLRRAAAATFQRQRHPDLRIEALVGIVSDGLAIGTAESMLAVLPDGLALLAMHEERMGRLGSAGSLYQLRHVDAYRIHRDLLLRLAGTASRLPPEAAQVIRQEFVLHADRLQLRPARRQMAIFRALADDKEMRERLAAEIAAAKPALAAAAAALAAAQTAGVSRDDLRSGDPQAILEIIGKAKPGESVYLEAGTVSTGKPMTAEGGSYVGLRAARRKIRRVLDAAMRMHIGATGAGVELPADWAGLTAGMTAEDGIVAFLESGADRPLQAAIITDSAEPRIVDLPGATRKETRSLVASAIEGLATNASPQTRALADLARILWHPLGDLPKRLTIVPNLSLVGLPFEALATRDGRLVVDAHSVRYSIGLDDRIGQHEEIESIAGALVMGAEEFRRLQLDPLAEARLEVEAIRTKMHQAQVRVGPASSLPRTGSDLLAPAANVDLIHVSTHSIWDAADTLFDRLAFPDEDVLAVELALSPLRTKLAVFSACSLFRNRGKGTQPVSGLTTSTLAVIAPQVVSALWAVESRGTRIFMTAFQENLLWSREPARALAETKRMFRDPVRLQAWALKQGSRPGEVRQLTSPYYWAAFVLAVRTPGD